MGQLLGPNFLQFLLLALAGALVVGNVAALVRPPAKRSGEQDLAQAPVRRSLVMIGIGLVVVIWIIASLVV
jgi:hypothetical protein